MSGRMQTIIEPVTPANSFKGWRPWRNFSSLKAATRSGKGSIPEKNHGLNSPTVVAFRKLEKQFLESDQKDLALLSRVEEARVAACLYVAKNCMRGNFKTRLQAMKFIITQNRKAMNQLMKRTKNLRKWAEQR